MFVAQVMLNLDISANDFEIIEFVRTESGTTELNQEGSILS